MKKDKEWLIEEINKLEKSVFLHRYGVDTKVKKDELLYLVNQLDELQKVTVPKWFDEWVKKNIIPERRTYSRLYELFSDELAMELTLEQNDWIESHIEEAIRAILDGYEVEKEKLYWVRNKYGESLIFRSSINGKITNSCGDSVKAQERKANQYQFTEAEIKDYDERYVPFMVPVEEVDNE